VRSDFLSEQKKVTRQELEENDGKDGKPAYIVYQGKVYEVSQSSFWMDGDHLGMHQAGKDLTEELEMAPHKEENLQKVKLVGDLI
jgi:predicted heme/steroid binding protein